MIKLLVLCFVLAALAGCRHKTVASFLADSEKKTDDPSAENENGLPTHAQPKLPTIKLYLGAETLDAEMALTPRQEETGMMFRTNILDTDSMIFVLGPPQQASFWMTNCPESISAAYITPDGIIAEIHHLEKNDATPVVSAVNNIQFVLETSDGWFARHHVGVGTEILTEKGTLAQTFFHR